MTMELAEKIKYKNPFMPMIYSEHIYLGNFLKQTSISLSFPDINTIQTSPLSVTSQIPRACITIFHQVLRSRMPLKKHWIALAPHGHNHVSSGTVPHTEELLTNGQWCPPLHEEWQRTQVTGRGRALDTKAAVYLHGPCPYPN